MAYNFSPKVITDGLILYLDAANTKSYPGSGTVWSDLSRGGNNGTLINGPTFNTGSLGSIMFDGVNDSMSTGAFPNLETTNRTISTFFQILSYSTSSLPSGRGTILNLERNDFNDIPAACIRYHRSSDPLSIGMGTAAYVTTSVPALNSWTNITISIIGNTVYAYRNGILIGTAVNASTFFTNPILRLGRGNVSRLGNVNISYVSIYNRALSAQEILQNYNATKSRFGL
jgi:hypothetical protein